MQRDMAALVKGADCGRERLAAVFALVHARPGALTLQLRNAVAHDATTRADCALRPQNALKVSAGSVVIMEDRVAKNDFFAGHYGALLNPATILHLGVWYVKMIIPGP